MEKNNKKWREKREGEEWWMRIANDRRNYSNWVSNHTPVLESKKKETPTAS